MIDCTEKEKTKRSSLRAYRYLRNKQKLTNVLSSQRSTLNATVV